MKTPLVSALTPDRASTRRFWGFSSPVCGRYQLNVDFFNRIGSSRNFACRGSRKFWLRDDLQPMKGPEAVDTPDPQRRANTDLPRAAGVPRLLGARPLQPPLQPKPRSWRFAITEWAAGSANTTPPTPRPPRERSKRTPLPASPRASTVPQRSCVPCTWCGVRRSRRAPRRRTSCALLVTAPEELKAKLRDLSTAKLVATAERFRPGGCPKALRAATRLVMRSVATGGFPRR